MEGLISNFLCTLLFCTLLFFTITPSSSVDTISKAQSIKDGGTIVSAGRVFELGFFSPGNSKNWYVGIWYRKISPLTTVWVANRDLPLVNNSGTLTLTDGGILMLLNATNSIIWSSNSSRSIQNPVAQLLDSGNLVVRDEHDNNAENFSWQTADYPCDTHLPGMKLGKNIITGLDRYLTSWNSNEDPSRGVFTHRLDPNGFPQLILRKDQVVQFRTGPWNGLRFTGNPNLKPNPLFNTSFVFNEEEIYLLFGVHDPSQRARMVLNPNGLLQLSTWVDRKQTWVIYFTAQTDNCDTYGYCGAYGTCNIANTPACACVKGFVPKVQQEWDRADWSNGCVRRITLTCQIEDGFFKYSSVKLPDTRNSWFNRTISLEECRMVCLKNCSCMAYATLDIVSRRGCLLWFTDLIDIREYTENGQDVYIRMAASELDKFHTKNTRWVGIIVALAISTTVLLSGFWLILHLWRKRIKEKQGRQLIMGHKGGKNDEIEVPFYEMATLANATHNFSNENKLGEGGFGPVYKGVMRAAQEIAVKRRSKNSSQGLKEFKNEVLCIAKLQHRNLVKLLGYSVHHEETMLIYEFMQNKSLDLFIFDETRRKLLDWQKRFHIINGIARGLLYLHQDSRLRVIHRDLKASNVLLDDDLNPKISDFGLARIFGGNEDEANTNRVVGTYGYLAPEYATNGLFSIKSDVFSFGVLVLEILSGKRNRYFHHPDHQQNLLGHAWMLYNGGGSLELLDFSIDDSCELSRVLRTINVALLCVQQHPEDRPTIVSVVLMLSGDGALPQPKKPGFFADSSRNNLSWSLKPEKSSDNGVTITSLAAR